ncbi:retron-type reverse transcriptase [Bradyrhizobium yuanmingense]
MTEAKSYQIPKHLVWEAWKQVKANRGSAGVDGVSIEEFEKDLKRNLYKIWNRMSSGTYFFRLPSVSWKFPRLMEGSVR